MYWNEDDDFSGELSPEERAEHEREMQENERQRKNHPLTKQSIEVYNIVSTLVDILPEKEKERHGNLLLESAMIIRAKLAGAIGSESYLICMQNAAIVRSHAEYLRLSYHTLRTMTSTGKEYAALLRREMETFRELFREWVQEFQVYEDEVEDEWGLFRK